MSNPHYLKLDERFWLLLLIMIPIMLGAFPLPFALPIAIICLVIDQPEEWPLVVIYFGWLTISFLLIWLNERKPKRGASAHENLNTPDCIRTFTGKYVNVFRPMYTTLCIEDITHALANQSRFGGHLPKFYSVAQHCVLAAEIAEPGEKLAALLHDASEAYMIDVPRPIKQKLLNYKQIEDGLMHMIAFRLGFKYPLTPSVKAINEHMLSWEWESLMLGNRQVDKIRPWSPREAERRFLRMYKQLTK